MLGWSTECSANIPIYFSLRLVSRAGGVSKSPSALWRAARTKFHYTSIHCNWYASHRRTFLQVTNHICCFRAVLFKRINECHPSTRALAWRNWTHSSITVHKIALHFTPSWGSCDSTFINIHFLPSPVLLWGGLLNRYSDVIRAGLPGFQSREGQESFFYSAQTGSSAHLASCLMGTGFLFQWKMRPGGEADHSPPSSVEVKNVGAIPLLPHTSLWSDA
jgi:hypothetical protein